jgi:Right handed beta helix region
MTFKTVIGGKITMKHRRIIQREMIVLLLLAMGAAWGSPAWSQTPAPTYTPGPSPTPTPPPFTTVYVPYDFRTIQDALDQAVAHTLIRVIPGCYTENLVWPPSGGIRLEADGLPGSVVVDGMYQDRVLTIQNISDAGATITGLRLVHGKHTNGGAGVLVDHARVVFHSCEIFDNEADAMGLQLIRPGIDCRESHLTLIGCHIHNHLASHSDGSALTISNTDQTVYLEGCRFTRNYLLAGDGYAAGITHLGGILIVKNCDFSGNGAENGSVVACNGVNSIQHCLFHHMPPDISGQSAVLLNSPGSQFLYNTVSDNQGTGIEINSSSALIRGNIVSNNLNGIVLENGTACLEYNDVWLNGQDYIGVQPGITDFSADPIFVDGPRDAYYLSQIASGQEDNSPCLDAGDTITHPSGYTRTDHEPDVDTIDVGYHRSTDCPEIVPTWTPTPHSTPPHNSPTPTAVHPTTTPVDGVLLVPEHYATIQEALDAAQSMMTINVGPGVYMGNGNRDLNFHGKGVIVESRSGPLSTIIDCAGSLTSPHRGVIFMENEPSTAVLRGFTIRNGYHVEGGGIKILSGANPNIQNCRFIDCYASSYGGGICADDSNFILENSECIDCFASDGGGGLAISGQQSVSAVIYRSTFQDNICSIHTGGGGGIFIRDRAKPYITSCKFFGNQGLALLVDSGGSNQIQVANCLFVNNQGGVEARNGSLLLDNCTLTENSQFAVKGNLPLGLVEILRSCIWGPEDFVSDINETKYSNLPGGDPQYSCFYEDPLFVTGHYGDYYIQQNSPPDPVSPNMNRGGKAVYYVSFQGPYYRIYLSDLTTAKNEMLDERFSDIGYHYYPSDLGPTPTPEPTHGRPIIEDVLGSTEHFDSANETVILLSAQVDHPLGPDYIDSVEVYMFDNVPLGFFLSDDDHDGRYTAELHFVTSEAPPSESFLNIVAFGKDGYPSSMVPYILKVDEETPEMHPSLDGRYFWYTLIEPGKNELGFIWFMTRVTHPMGLDHIERVELMYEGSPTGIQLFDDGHHEDMSAGDGYYGTMILLSGSQIPSSVNVTLDIQATDRQGNVSHAWPVAWSTR